MRYFLFFILSLGALSCNQKTFETQEELLMYIKNPINGCFHQKNINGINISLLYRPTDLLVLQEVGDSDKNTSEIVELRKKYRDFLYFNLNFSKNNNELLTTLPNNRSEFSSMLNQLAFGMTDKIYLLNAKKDTLPMLDYVYPRMYGMSNATSLMLVFPRDEEFISDTFFNVVIKDFGLLTGELKFKFSPVCILEEPQIKFKI